LWSNSPEIASILDRVYLRVKCLSLCAEERARRMPAQAIEPHRDPLDIWTKSVLFSSHRWHDGLVRPREG
jgi:hypothetical protein